MGFLRAAEFAPFLVLTLPAGVWADLGIRRVLMIGSNLIRGVLIIFVPVVFYATREIGFRPGVFGMAVSVGGLGAVIGSLTAQRLGASLGPGPFVIYACVVTSLAAFCFPLVSHSNEIGVICLTTAYFALSASGAAITVFAWTIRQAMTPSELLGKMNGAFRFCVTGIVPFGALFGGTLGGMIGIRQTMVVSAIGLLASCLVGSYSHLGRLKTLP